MVSSIVQKSRPMIALAESNFTLPEFKMMDAYLSVIDSHTPENRSVVWAKGELENLLEVDRCGLDNTDRSILTTIIYKFDGGPVGLDTLSAAIGEDPGTVEDVYEPYLIKNGFINRTPKGRTATKTAYEHLGDSRFDGDGDEV